MQDKKTNKNKTTDTLNSQQVRSGDLFVKPQVSQRQKWHKEMIETQKVYLKILRLIYISWLD